MDISLSGMRSHAFQLALYESVSNTWYIKDEQIVKPKFSFDKNVYEEDGGKWNENNQNIELLYQ